MSTESHANGENGNRQVAKVRDWLLIRTEYERFGNYRRLAKEHGIPETTMWQRIKREGWISNRMLVKHAVRNVTARVNTASQRKVEDQLAPFIEAEKAKFTRIGVSLAKNGVRRVKRMMANRHKEPEAKSEAFISKAAETYHRIGRVALGMGDGTATGAPINLNILTNRSAVQIISPDDTDTR